MKGFILRFLFILYLLIETVVTKPSSRLNNNTELDAEYWNDISQNSLRAALKQQIIHKKAKNVIIFLGDGMGVSTTTSARILKGQLLNNSGEESSLSFDNFPYISLIKTYNVDYQVSDSAGTATAFLCGVKTNLGTLGISARVSRKEKDCDIVEKNSVSSIMKWAIDSGKSAGIVTTTRITHATPAAGFANIADRDWEAYMPKDISGNCKDIALQLIEDEPGSKLKVILGGGRRSFIPTNETDVSGKKGLREDNRNLINEWINKRNESGLNSSAYQYANTRGKLMEINFDQIEYLFGLFNYDHMDYEKQRDQSDSGEPSIEEMTESAIKILSKNEKGFVLLVEGGRIDHAHHDNMAALSLFDTLAFDKAIEKAFTTLPKDETLIVVTADHSHALTINGYAKRGNSIFGLADKDTDSKPFTTLIYGNGPGFQKDRTDPSTVNTSDLRYKQLSAVHIGSSNHAGEDVAVYSSGPMAHLFQGTQEQSYVAHVMAYAACIGQYQNEDHCGKTSGKSSVYHQNIIHLYYFIPILFIIYKAL